jgi:small-conductance mechanosensitive channel
MKIFISDIDRQNTHSVALKNIARYFRIPDWEFKSNNDLKQEIENINNEQAKSINELLDQYFDAYEDWFDFYQEKKAIEVERRAEYELNQDEQSELDKLINRREKTLAKLQTEFDNFQSEEYNKLQFGTDISDMVNEA